MTLVRPLGRGLFYTRDSMGASELAPPQYVAWALNEARKLGVQIDGSPEMISAMIRDRISERGDLFLDYGISRNILSRSGFDAFRQRALADRRVSHLFRSAARSDRAPAKSS